MTKEQAEKLREIGFKVSEEDCSEKVTVQKAKIPDLASLEELILTLTFKDVIEYWDAYRRSSTDPGGYVTAIRWDDENVAYKDGNHGWSSRWSIISVQEMAKRMQKNWDKDTDSGKYLYKVVISRNKYVTREKIAADLNRQ